MLMKTYVGRGLVQVCVIADHRLRGDPNFKRTVATVLDPPKDDSSETVKTNERK